jgi:hypothetical protein
MIVLATSSVIVHTVEKGTDGHGWATSTVTGVRWVGRGNLQVNQPTGDTRASDRGGAGPNDPRIVITGNLYLPPDADVQAGDRVTVDGQRWRAETIQPTLDPTMAGLDTLTVIVTKVAA